MAPPKRNRRGLVNGNPSRRDERENQRNDRAWLAVKAFNELKPTLTSFARAVTGKSTVKVQASKTTCTDGDTVYIVPPIGLGDRLEHDRAVCDQRDPESLMKLCAACASRELLMRRMFHEIAHIAFESFAPVYKFERDKVHDMVDEWHPKDACNHAGALHAKVDAAENHNGLATAFHQFLYFILQAYDDARVDSKMYRARPGLKIPTEAGLRLIFTRGIERPDGSRVHWKDTPINGQVTIGLMMVGMGLDLREGYLSDEALEHLADPELVRISDRAHLANTVGNSFDIALAAFRRLQEMDLCYVPKCVPTPSLNAEPEPSDDKDDGDDSDSGEDSGGSGSGSEAEAPEDRADSDDADDRDTDDTSDGTPGESTESRDAGDGGHQQDADETPGSSDDGDDDFENDDSRGSGQDQEGGPGDDESEDREVRDGDDGPKPSEQSDDDEGDGDPADRHGDGAGGDPSEPDSGDDEGEPAGPTEGDSEDPSGEDDDTPARSGDDGAGERDDDGSDRTPGADAEGSGAGGADPGADDGADDEAEAGSDLEEADLGDADGERTGDALEGDDDLVEAEDDADEAEAPAPLGESVWDDDNPESEVAPPLTDEEREALMGSPEDVGDLMEQFLGHGHEEEIDAELLGEPVAELNENEAKRILQAMATAVGQEAVFDTSSKTVRGVQVVKYPHPAFGWGQADGRSFCKPADFMPAETVIGKNLMQARLVFSENKRAKTQGNLKSGKINTRVLGRRAALGDERLFKKRTLPGKRDYFVVIGADCSGSTNSNRRNERIKRAVFAKAELLNRLGIPFAIYGHTGGEGDFNVGWWADHPDDDEMTEAWMMEVKGPNEPWTDAIKQRLADMPPVAENLDGHSLEFYRKVAEKSTATDRIIIYYTDGAMPAANYDEELAILETEIANCRKKDITLMAVGINTNSPERFGFDTVCVQSDEDLSLVVDRLKSRLTS